MAACQVRELLLARDAAERELAAERSCNEELSRLLASLRAAEGQRKGREAGADKEAEAALVAAGRMRQG